MCAVIMFPPHKTVLLDPKNLEILEPLEHTLSNYMDPPLGPYISKFLDPPIQVL